jgi:hypothetical protein
MFVFANIKIEMIRYILLFLIALTCTGSFAQRYLSTERTVAIPKVLDVSVTSGSTTFSFTTTTNYDSGIEKTGLFAVTVKANVSWKLTLSVPAAYLSPQSTATPMPVSVFSTKGTTIFPSYSTLSYSTPLFATGSRGTYSYNLDVKSNPGYLYEQNTYLTDIYFTISEP